MCRQIEIQMKRLFFDVERRVRMQTSNREQPFNSLITANEKLEIQLAWFQKIDLYSTKDI